MKSYQTGPPPRRQPKPGDIMRDRQTGLLLEVTGLAEEVFQRLGQRARARGVPYGRVDAICLETGESWGGVPVMGLEFVDPLTALAHQAPEQGE